MRIARIVKNIVIACLAVLQMALVSVQAEAAPRWRSLAVKAETGSVGDGVREDLRRTDESTLEWTLEIPGFEEENVRENGRIFRKIRLPGETRLTGIGRPELPVIARLVAVPAGAKIRVEILRADERDFAGAPVFPRQPAPDRQSAGKSAAFRIDAQIYDSADAYPESDFRLSEPMRLRGSTFVRLEVRPFRYRPEQGNVRAAGKLVARLVSDRPFPQKIREPSLEFRRLFHDIALNPPDDRESVDAPSIAGHLLIVSHDDFLDDLESFIEWKRRTGYRVSVIPMSEVNGTTSQAVKSAVQDAYDTLEPKPDALLLVGDAEEVPTPTGIDNCNADAEYAMLEGADFVPDVFFGRFSAKNPDHLDAQTEKSLAYETDPVMGMDTEYYARGLAISSSEGFNPSDDERCDDMAEDLEGAGLRMTKLYHSLRNDTVEEITTNFRTGIGFAVYLGHGTGVQWSTTRPAFRNTEVFGLDNAPLVPFVMDVSCTNGAFKQLEPCFAEAWMRTGPDGSVAIYSASTATAWDESADLGAGMVRAYAEGKRVVGRAIHQAILDLVRDYGTGDNVREVVQQYVFFGDPTLPLRSRAPMEMDVQTPEFLPAGGGVFAVRVFAGGQALPDARVFVRAADAEVLAFTDAGGQATILLETQSFDPVQLTVTAPDTVPFLAELPVSTTHCGLLMAHGDTAGCLSGMNVTLSDADLNTDAQAVEQTSVSVFVNGQDVGMDAILTEDAPDSAIFRGFLDLSAFDPLLLDGDEVRLLAVDADCGGAPRDLETVFSIDCRGPMFDEIAIETPTTTSARVRWRTDETADSEVRLMGEPIHIHHDPALVSEHRLTLSNLSPGAAYVVHLAGTDRFGNRRVDDNGGNGYAFETPLCIPECGQNNCGGDGCGGDCGECQDGWVCLDGHCRPDCIPDCENQECGGDGCGGSCGDCPRGWSCEEGVCQLEEGGDGDVESGWEEDTDEDLSDGDPDAEPDADLDADPDLSETEEIDLAEEDGDSEGEPDDDFDAESGEVEMEPERLEAEMENDNLPDADEDMDPMNTEDGDVETPPTDDDRNGSGGGCSQTDRTIPVGWLLLTLFLFFRKRCGSWEAKR